MQKKRKRARRILLHRILVINLGGTSSKLAIFEDEKEIHDASLSHTPEEVASYRTINEQTEFRTKMVKDWMDSIGESMDNITAVAVRGGGLADFYNGGTYFLEGDLLQACLARFDGEESFIHGTQAVVRTALALMGDRQIPIYLTDPTTIDEQTPQAQLGGHPAFRNMAVFHALNSKAVARHVAELIGKKYEDSRFIVAHMGAGTSVGAHKEGKVVDVNNCMFGDGPMSPNRVGHLQTGQLVDWCYSGEHTKEETLAMIRKNGGVKAHLDTDDMREVEQRCAQGDEKARLVLDAYILQIAKEIGARSAALSFNLDGIILTGGVANSPHITQEITRKVKNLASVYVVAGEMENQGLAMGAYRVLTGQEEPQSYKLEKVSCRA